MKVQEGHSACCSWQYRYAVLQAMDLVDLGQAGKMPLLELFKLISGYTKRCNEYTSEILLK